MEISIQANTLKPAQDIAAQSHSLDKVMNLFLREYTLHRTQDILSMYLYLFK